MNERWVVLCSHCQGACLHQEVSRPVSTHITLWSDQYIEGAPGPQWDRLARCAHCLRWMWLDQVDTEPWNPTDFATLPMLAPMLLADWLQAQEIASTAEQQMYIYRQIWMHANHLRRHAPSLDFDAIASDWQSAMEAYLPFVEDARLHIELLREMGQFEAALSACEKAVDLDEDWLERQRNYCYQQNQQPFIVRQVAIG